MGYGCQRRAIERAGGVLPARAPELNPIELVFHILLACRICLFRYRMAGPCDAAVVRQMARVLNDVTLETIVKCCIHCGC
jgi:delta-aminolevulinic acid dehydratase/porphobilinogen synthase